jgi:predicted permease
MARWQELLRRGIYLGRRSRFDDELHDEMQFHMEMRAGELEASGLSRRDALATARREFGSPVRLAEATRHVWQFQWLEDLAVDFRYAARSCRRHPAFALSVGASLALGLGANSAVFTALDAVFWKPLAITEPERLVRVSATRASGDQRYDYIPREYLQYMRDAGVFTDIVAQTSDGLSFVFDGRAERIMGEAVSPQLFSVLGVKPALGQAFSPEVRAGRWDAQAVLSYRFWKRRFGGDPSVIGRTIRLNTYPFVVVGVLPPSYLDVVQGQDPEVRVPTLPARSELAQIGLVSAAPEQPVIALGRLRPDISAARVESMLNARLPEFVRLSANPRVNGARDRWTRVHVSSAARGMTGSLDRLRAPLVALFVLAGMVLLTACANVVGMLIARASARQRELAARVALGAGRARIARQLFAESLVLALIAAALATPFMYATARILPAFLPKGHISLALDLRPDARVLLFTAALALITGVVIGLLSAFHATRGDLTGALKAGAAAAVGEGRRIVARRTLVAGQVAFSLVMLVVAGLFVRSLTNLRPTGFAGPTDRVLLFTMKFQPEQYPSDQARVLVDRLRVRMAALPGVQAVAVAETGPLASRQSTMMVRAGGRDSVLASSDDVTPGFFDGVGLRLIAGRDFRPSDSPSSALVAIINATLARRLFGGEQPIGRTVELGFDRGIRAFTVIGVAADVQYHDVHVPPAPTIWTTYQRGAPYMPTLVVRTMDANTGKMLAAIMRELDAIDTGFPVFDVRSLDSRIGDALARERMVAALSRAFGVLALLLAAVGLYSVLAFSVSQKTREIGLRMALGSSLSSVRWLVIRDAAAPVVAGVGVGVAVALLAGRMIAREFLGVAATDVIAIGVAIAVMGLIAGIAVFIPALRASRVDPLTALRAD